MVKKEKVKLIRNIIIFLLILGLIFYFKMHAEGTSFSPFDGVMAVISVGG